jgi:alkanesulfonate monooxygenase SsuD/methylene tetrahydromethanopterin reductase-like flavin-dependent oxidoreductase (luciferase family)
MKIGFRYPLYGEFGTRERIFNGAPSIEKAGFYSIWLRDHLYFQPHAWEKQVSNILEPFTTLSAIAAVTEKLVLGTATVVPYRHPLVTSALFGTLAYIAKGRIIAGIGAGGIPAPFEAVGLPFEKRGKMVEEFLQILRLTFDQDHVSFHGEFYNFDDVTIDPKPPADTPLYYGGLSKAAMRRAVTYCDGILLQHAPFKILDDLVAHMRKLEEKQKKEKPTVLSYSPWLSIDRDSQKAWERMSLQKVAHSLRHQITQDERWKEISDRKEDLEGAMICGSPQECVDQMARFKERGYDELALDLRNTLDRWDESLELLATEVLPHFKE